MSRWFETCRAALGSRADLIEEPDHIRAESIVEVEEMTKDRTSRENAEDAQRGLRETKKEQHANATLVSVVIPCYNQAHFLGEAIESVLAQSHPYLEVIVVDDGSTDNTSEVAARYPGVHLVRQENRGLSGARNTGLRESKGSYLVFLDADDRLLPGALEAGLECFDAHPDCGFVHGHYRDITVDGSPLPEWSQPIVGTNRHYAALLRNNYISMHASVMYRRAVLESVGGFDTSLSACEDYDLFLRVARKFQICSHEKMVAEYRQHDTNMTRDSALLLSTSMSVLRSQRKYAKENKQYLEAYETGIRFWRDWYGDSLVDKVRAHVREREWKRAVRSMVVLLRYYPRGLALLSERRMEQRRLVRQLQAREQRLEFHEQRIRKLESTLAKERQQVQRLRQRTRRLKRRMQKLDRRARIGRNGKIWRSLTRLGRIRGKVLGT